MTARADAIAHLRSRLSEAIDVPHATDADLDGFEPKRNECHKNVKAWCALHPDHKPTPGWLITSGFHFDKHSVVDRGAAGLLDITPLGDRNVSVFLPHDGSIEEWKGMPDQVVVVDPAWHGAGVGDNFDTDETLAGSQRLVGC